jgi:hypothetical protein
MTDITTLRDALFAMVPTDGGTIGNYLLLGDTLLPRPIPGQFRLPKAEEACV